MPGIHNLLPVDVACSWIFLHTTAKDPSHCMKSPKASTFFEKLEFPADIPLKN